MRKKMPKIKYEDLKNGFIDMVITEYDLGILTDNDKTKILIGASAEDEDVVSITGTGNLDVKYGDKSPLYLSANTSVGSS